VAEGAIALAETRLIEDRFPEYYDGKQGRLIGKEASLSNLDAWIASHKEIMANPKHIELLSLGRKLKVRL